MNLLGLSTVETEAARLRLIQNVSARGGLGNGYLDIPGPGGDCGARERATDSR